MVSALAGASPDTAAGVAIAARGSTEGVPRAIAEAAVGRHSSSASSRNSSTDDHSIEAPRPGGPGHAPEQWFAIEMPGVPIMHDNSAVGRHTFDGRLAAFGIHQNLPFRSAPESEPGLPIAP